VLQTAPRPNHRLFAELDNVLPTGTKEIHEVLKLMRGSCSKRRCSRPGQKHDAFINEAPNGNYLRIIEGWKQLPSGEIQFTIRTVIRCEYI
jgi:hypothetical protein